MSNDDSSPADRGSGFSAGLGAAVSKLQQWACKHRFVGADMQPRDALGMVRWPCSKCGKVYREPYGLLMAKHGQIGGPWASSIVQSHGTGSEWHGGTNDRA